MSEKNFSLTSMGLVRELADFLWLDGEIKTHPDWVESLACELIATFMGRDRFLSNKFGQLRGNGMTIVVGASGLSYKTVSLKLARPIVRKAIEIMNDDICRAEGFASFDDFNKKQEEHEFSKPRRKAGGQSNEDKEEMNKWIEADIMIKKVKRVLVDYEGPTKFTSEGLTIFLIKNPQCVIMGDEYTKLFRGSRTKDYLSDNMEDLSRLYDCEVDKYATVGRGLEYPDDAYVSFVSATTYYLLKLMDDDFFIQGTGNRIKWILDDLDKRLPINVEKEALSADFFWGPDRQETRNKKIDVLARKLLAIRGLPKSSTIPVIQPDLKASVTLDIYRLKTYNEALTKIKQDLFDRDANLMSRLAENAMKLAMIHCVGRCALEVYEDKVPYPENKMEINNEDAEWAINKTRRHFDHYIKMFRRIAPRTRKGTTKSYKNDFERVLVHIEDNQGYINVTKLRQKTGWTGDDASRILTDMIGMDMIEAKKIKPRQSKEHMVFVKHGDKIPHVEDNLTTQSICARCGKKIIGPPSLIGSEMVCKECIDNI